MLLRISAILFFSFRFSLCVSDSGTTEGNLIFQSASSSMSGSLFNSLSELERSGEVMVDAFLVPVTFWGLVVFLV